MFAKALKVLFISWIIIVPNISHSIAEGEGRFYANEDDSLNFVKKQLLYSAFKDVITKEMKKMKLDSDLFWQKYDSRFNEYFHPIQSNLEEKFKVADKEEVDKESKQYKAFEKSLRLKRLRLKSNFGSLSRAIKKYSIKKMSRSTRFANSRYLNLKAEIDPKILHSIFIKYTSNGLGQKFQKLYLSVKINNQNFGWNEVEVQLEEDFTNVVKNHWRDWISKRFKSKIEDVIITNESIEKTINEYANLPKTVSSDMEETNSDSSFSNTLWLKINVDLKKVGEDSLLKSRQFEISGDYLLLDLKNNALVDYMDFTRMVQKYSFKDSNPLSSQLASFIYNIPLQNFADLGPKLASADRSERLIELEIANIKSIDDLLAVSKELTKVGVTMNFRPSISSYNGSKGKIALGHSGNIKDLTSTIQKIEGVSVGSKVNRYISFPVKERPLSISIKQKNVKQTTL